MIPEFEHLSEPEQQQLLKAPVLIAILIAGADHDIHRKEKEMAAKLVRYRTFTSEKELNPYYRAVDEIFDPLLTNYLLGTGSNGTERLANVSEELSKLNAILPKLDPVFRKQLRKSWYSYGEKIAEAAGGILGFGSISTEEDELLKLPMLDPEE